MFDARTASLVLQQLLYDGYKDDGKVPAGYKFKVMFGRNMSSTPSIESHQNSKWKRDLKPKVFPMKLDMKEKGNFQNGGSKTTS